MKMIQPMHGALDIGDVILVQGDDTLLHLYGY